MIYRRLNRICIWLRKRWVIILTECNRAKSHHFMTKPLDLLIQTAGLLKNSDFPLNGLKKKISISWLYLCSIFISKKYSPFQWVIFINNQIKTSTLFHILQGCFPYAVTENYRVTVHGYYVKWFSKKWDSKQIQKWDNRRTTIVVKIDWSPISTSSKCKMRQNN